MTRVWIPGEDDVLQCLYRLGPSNSREIACELKGGPVTQSEVFRVSRRLSTLRAANKIVHCWRNMNKVAEDGTVHHSTYKVYKVAEGSQ